MTEIRPQYHDFYNLEKENERFMTESYIGGELYKNKDNLFKYINENQIKYKDRLKRSFLINFMQPIVSEIKDAIFAKELQRDCTKKELFARFVQSATLAGDSLSDVMEDLAIYGCLYKVGVLVDGANFTEEFGTIEKSMRDRLRLFSSVKIILPHQILDYCEDESGRLKWVLLDCSYIDKSAFGAKQTIKKYVLWDSMQFITTTFTENEPHTEITEHNLGEVPFFFFKKKELHRDPLAKSIFEDVAIMQRAIYNYLSLIDEDVYSSIIPMLLVKIGGTPFNEEKKTGTGFSIEHNTFYYEEVPPQLLKPEFLDPDTIIRIIDMITKEIYRKVGRYLDANNTYAQSGVAKDIDNKQRANALTNYARQLENAENKILSLFAKWEGIDFTEYDQSVYPEEFDVISLASKIDDALKMNSLFANSLTAQNAIKKDLIDSRFGNKLTVEEKKKIEEELLNPSPDFT